MSVREPWVKIAARMPNNPKVRDVSVAARWSYTASICYAGANLSDGYIPSSSLPGLDANKKVAAELTAVGLWEEVAGGWVIHDFLKWNRSRETVEQTSEVRAEIGSKGGKTRWQNATKPDAKTKANSSLSAPVSGSPQGDPRSAADLCSPDPDDYSQTEDPDENQTDGYLLSTTPEIPTALRARLIAKYAPVASTEDVEVEIARCLGHHGAKQKKKAFDYGRATHSWLRTTFGRELQLKVERDARNRPADTYDRSEPASVNLAKYQAACEALVKAGRADSVYSAKQLMPFDEWRIAEFSEAGA